MNEWQRELLKYLCGEVIDAQTRFHAGEKIIDDIKRLGAYSYGLYADMARMGSEVRFSPDLLRNREFPPIDPQFFQHLHAIIDFVQGATRMLADQQSEA